MYRTVELGQLATEYLDNRKCEFQTLQKMVKSDMAERDEDVTRTTAEVNERFRNFKFSLRKDVKLNQIQFITIVLILIVLERFHVIDTCP